MYTKYQIIFADNHRFDVSAPPYVEFNGYGSDCIEDRYNSIMNCIYEQIKNAALKTRSPGEADSMEFDLFVDIDTLQFIQHAMSITGRDANEIGNAFGHKIELFKVIHTERQVLRLARTK